MYYNVNLAKTCGLCKATTFYSLYLIIISSPWIPYVQEN